MDLDTCILEYISYISFDLCLQVRVRICTAPNSLSDDLPSGSNRDARAPRRRDGFANEDWTTLGHLDSSLTMLLTLS